MDLNDKILNFERQSLVISLHGSKNKNLGLNIQNNSIFYFILFYFGYTAKTIQYKMVVCKQQHNNNRNFKSVIHF